MKETITNFLNFSDNQLLRVLLIILLALVAQVVIKATLRSVLRFPLNGDLFPNQKRDREKRIKTINSIAETTAMLAIWFIAGVLILSVFHVPLAPLLTSAGLIGAALAFGMQSLIKDFVSGIFIISENQYRVDDYVELDKVSGKVEAITVRTTVLRDTSGRLIHVPNGSIGVTTNLSMGPLVAYEQIDIDASMTVEQFEAKLKKISDEISADSDTSKLVKNGPILDGIVKITNKATTVSIRFTTSAPKRNAATNAVLSAIKKHQIPLA